MCSTKKGQGMEADLSVQAPAPAKGKAKGPGKGPPGKGPPGKTGPAAPAKAEARRGCVGDSHRSNHPEVDRILVYIGKCLCSFKDHMLVLFGYVQSIKGFFRVQRAVILSNLAFHGTSSC